MIKDNIGLYETNKYRKKSYRTETATQKLHALFFNVSFDTEKL